MSLTNVTIYHHPNCSKSRQTLDYLQNTDLEVNIIDYIKTPPTKEELARLIELSHQPLSAFIRENESVYQSLGIAQLDNEADILQLMIEHPILIQRPIVVVGEQVIIARPPERVFDILPKS